MNRRSFLQTAAGAALFPSLSFAAEADEPPVLDTHVHLWDLKEFKLPWLSKDAPFGKDFLISDYLTATKGTALKKAIYMEVDVIPEQKQKEADWIRGVCKEGKTPLVGAIVGGVLSDEGFKKYAAQFKGDPYIRGFRNAPQGKGLEKQFLASCQLIGELGMTFDFLVGHKDIPHATQIAEKCPGTTFILDHCGNPDMQAKNHTQWKKDIEALARLKNVNCKISGILYTLEVGKWGPDTVAPIINHCLDTFGPDRVVFAADWPVCLKGGTFKEWLAAVQAVTKTRKAAERKAFFFDNAVKIYGVKV